MDNSNQLVDQKQMLKLFRAFELSTEYRQIMNCEKRSFKQMLRLLSGVIEYQFLDYYFAKVPRWRILARKLSGKKRIVPNYVMIGPIKCGSSDLVSHLLMHPNIIPPIAKELEQLRIPDWRLYYPTEQEKLQLEQQTGHPVWCGFLEPFLNNMALMERLYDLNPDNKIIITLRDPVARAYSQWKWEIFLGGQQALNDPYLESFEKYIERAINLFPSVNTKTFCGFPLLSTGIYYKSVEQWVNRFGKENVMILDTAEYFRNRQPTLEKIQNFLNLPVVDIPEYAKVANENPIKLPKATAETKALLSEFYQPFNQKLFDYIGQEFDWQ